MQTFLPYERFAQSAAVLDRQRLGKQRVENLQIMNVLMGHKTGGWVNHPAVRMWRGYVPALFSYQYAICHEWTEVRGYRDTCFDKTRAACEDMIFTSYNSVLPPWLGDPAFHASHRSNLLRKDEEFYRQWGWTEPTTLEYVWPA